ncbi:MAG: hypothetical protein BMS9Abin13_508 [Patescibacteria group bacterium]|nr:MAG: hypothetical protein BMS9Abin13_508 [Patescibacteria group bacterium]
MSSIEKSLAGDTSKQKEGENAMHAGKKEYTGELKLSVDENTLEVKSEKIEEFDRKFDA